MAVRHTRAWEHTRVASDPSTWPDAARPYVERWRLGASPTAVPGLNAPPHAENRHQRHESAVPVCVRTQAAHHPSGDRHPPILSIEPTSSGSTSRQRKRSISGTGIAATSDVSRRQPTTASTPIDSYPSGRHTIFGHGVRGARMEGKAYTHSNNRFPNFTR